MDGEIEHPGGGVGPGGGPGDRGPAEGEGAAPGPAVLWGDLWWAGERPGCVSAWAHRRGLTVVAAVAAGARSVVLHVEGVPLAAAGSDLAFRRSGVWFDLVTEELGRRWSLGLEAFALAVDPGVVVDGDTRGDRVPLGFDLGVERIGAGPGVVVEGEVAVGAEVVVEGEVAVGAEVVALDAAPGRFRWGGTPAAAGDGPDRSDGPGRLVVDVDGEQWERGVGDTGWGRWRPLRSGRVARRRP